MIERLTPLLAFKSSSLVSTGSFTGFASTFNGPVDSYGDVIAPGAFTKSLAEHGEKGTVPAMLWAHDQDEPIGRWTDIKQSAAGLEVSGKLTLETKRGAEAYALMKDGALSMSIGFSVKSGGFERLGDGYLLKQINLYEVSLVAMPANHAAKITSVKSIRPANIRDLEEGLRELGFSSREAKCIASKGWAALAGDQQDEELKQVAELLKAAAQTYSTK
jgi:HK97 family phage prohead protease